MHYREATLADLPATARIIDDAVTRMLREGKCQWTREYPAPEHLFADIVGKRGFVLTDERDAVLAYGAVVLSGEAAYGDIDGEWLSADDCRYVVVHRLAVAQSAQGRGVGAMFLRAVERYAVAHGAESFRIDTNFDNRAMLRLLEKCGFERCGTVRYDSGERIAFEKLI